MIDSSSLVANSYQDVVKSLREKLKDAIKDAKFVGGTGQKFEIAVFGHGGRDTNLTLALLEAANGDEALKHDVKITQCTCSWTDDTWEQIMDSYLKLLKKKGVILEDSIDFQVLKYHEEVGVTVSRVKKAIEGKHCVVQCEQGVDMFIEPLTSEWLQDNYEDFCVHTACLTFAEEACIPVFLIQTNADLDEPRGIDGKDVSEAVFDGKLQYGGAMAVGIRWKESSEVKDKLPNILQLSLKLNNDKFKDVQFKELLNYDVEEFESLPSLYAAYIAYSAKEQPATLIPVAGILEVITALLENQHEMPFELTCQPPKPQWVTARLLQPHETDFGYVRVASQWRAAGCDSAQTFAGLWSKWMFARCGRRERNLIVSGRCAPDFALQLECAKHLADEVLEQCPGFELWSENSSEFLQQVLERMALHVESEDEHYQMCAKLAKAGQPDFKQMSPLWKFGRALCIHILDFTCRLLEAKAGVNAEYEQIKSRLQLTIEQADKHRTRDTSKEPIYLYKQLFQKALIKQWKEKSGLDTKPSSSSFFLPGSGCKRELVRAVCAVRKSPKRTH